MPVSAWMIDAIDPQPGHTLLELAAGTGDTGLLAAELIEPGGTLISSDFAPEMLQAAQRRAEELGVAQRPLQADRRRHEHRPRGGGIDGVLCRWGYMLMADPRERAARDAPRAAARAGASRSPRGPSRTRTRGARSPAASWSTRGLLEMPPTRRARPVRLGASRR